MYLKEGNNQVLEWKAKERDDDEINSHLLDDFRDVDNMAKTITEAIKISSTGWSRLFRTHELRKKMNHRNIEFDVDIGMLTWSRLENCV